MNDIIAYLDEAEKRKFNTLKLLVEKYEISDEKDHLYSEISQFFQVLTGILLMITGAAWELMNFAYCTVAIAHKV